MIHQFNPDMPPDSDFVPGGLAHLVPGNQGRLLDPRRTPIRIVALKLETGVFVCELLDFEDKGARWELPFEDASSFQFPPESNTASPLEVQELEAIAACFDQPLEIGCDASARARTLERLERMRHEAAGWLDSESTFFRSGATLDAPERAGDRRLSNDLESYMASRGLWEIEDGFAAQYVCNPRSGERVKGHAIVLAELGLAEYRGTVVRDLGIFDGRWSKAVRADHILARMAFVQEAFTRLSSEPPMLYRGIATRELAHPGPRGSFVSATFSREVAMSVIDPAGRPADGVLFQQRTPIRRLFMTYLETEHMNRQFHEAEAVLLAEREAALF